MSASSRHGTSAAVGAPTPGRPRLAAVSSSGAFSLSTLLRPPPPDVDLLPPPKRPRLEPPALSAPPPSVDLAALAHAPAPAPDAPHADAAAATAAVVAPLSSGTRLSESKADPWAQYESAMAALRRLGDF